MDESEDLSCGLCGAETARLGVVQHRTLRHCPRCDLLQAAPGERLSVEAQRARYLQHRNSLEDAGYVRRLEAIIELLRAHAPAARRVLDYGCGPSPVLVELLRRAGFEADGYDPLFASDTVLAPSYAAVTCVETMEHFEHPRADFARLAGLLRPGGVLVATTLLHPGPDRLADWWYLRDRTHVAFYSARTIAHLSQAFGLEPLWSDGTSRFVLRRGAS